MVHEADVHESHGTTGHDEAEVGEIGDEAPLQQRLLKPSPPLWGSFC